MAIVTTRSGANGRARPSLGDQLDRLDGILNGLSDALNDSVTAAVSAVVGKAVREAVESATLEIVARPTPPAAATTHPDNRIRHPLGRWLAVGTLEARRTFRYSCRTLGRLAAPLVVVARRALTSPAKCAAWIVAGAATGMVIGYCGPANAAALSGLAGAAIILWVAATTASAPPG